MDMSLIKLRELVMDREGSLACCSPWGCKESDMTEWLNWSELRALFTSSSSRMSAVRKELKSVTVQYYQVKNQRSYYGVIFKISIVLVSFACCSTLLQTWRFKTTETYSFIFGEIRGSAPVFSGPQSLQKLWVNPFLSLPASARVPYLVC